MHAWIFSSLSISSVDDKQHLSVVVFSAPVGFSLTSRIRSSGCTRTPSTRHQWLWCSWSLGHCLWRPACSVRLQHKIAFALLQSFRHFPDNENPTRALNTTSLKCYLQSTDTIDRCEKNSRMRKKVQGCLMQVRFIEIQLVSEEKNQTLF